MKNLMITATAVLISISSAALAGSMDGPRFGTPDVMINKPIQAAEKSFELTCYGCISPNTGRSRNNFVRPHYRNNGTFVDGYWRS